MPSMLFPPLRIGGLVFEAPLIQAPLSGYSDAPMRRLARRFGASFALCEVFLDQFVLSVSKHSKSRLYLDVNEADKPSGAQLMGASSEDIVPAALKLLECGFELIDLNYACPVKKVIGKNRGGYLISDPVHAVDVAKKVRAALPSSVPITVKLRRGYDDTEASKGAFWELLAGLLDVGISGVAVHGRTVAQRYQGTADWNFLRDVKEYVSAKKNRPDFAVIGCGDLFSAETVIRRMRESGVDGVALARGVIGNPWLFQQTRAAMEGLPIPEPPTLSEQKKLIGEHFQDVVKLYGERRATTVMRKFGVAYSRLHPESEKVRLAFAQCKSPSRWFEILDEFY